VKRRHTTIPEHMPSAHRRYAFWTPARLLAAAEKIGPSTVALWQPDVIDGSCTVLYGCCRRQAW
jgi:transposase